MAEGEPRDSRKDNMAWITRSDSYEFTCDLIRETAKAWLLGLGGKSEGEREVWAPKSQIKFLVRQEKCATLTLPHWLVAKERLWHWVEAPHTPKTEAPEFSEDADDDLGRYGEKPTDGYEGFWQNVIEVAEQDLADEDDPEKIKALYESIKRADLELKALEIDEEYLLARAEGALGY